MNNIVVFDLETTGLDKTKDQIIQFAAIKIDKDTNNIVDELNLYIQPTGNYNISIQAYFKHGIKPEFLSDKPYFKDVANNIVNFFETPETVEILTYNGISFDLPFLISEFAKVGIDFSFMKYNCYDAFVEEKRRFGNKLEDTYKRYKGKTMEESGLTAHDAFSDVKATYTVFYAQQRNCKYGPEQMFGDDNTITINNFQGTEQPCFNIGKYKYLPVSYISTIDAPYLQWCISDKSNFTTTTKDYIKQFI